MKLKNKLLTGVAGLLLASSSMFAGWGVRVGVGVPYVAPRVGVVVAGGPVYPYYGPRYHAPGPYAVAPAPYPVYAAPAPLTFWVGGGWHYGPRGRYWVPGYWAHRR